MILLDDKEKSVWYDIFFKIKCSQILDSDKDILKQHKNLFHGYEDSHQIFLLRFLKVDDIDKFLARKNVIFDCKKRYRTNEKQYLTRSLMQNEEEKDLGDDSQQRKLALLNTKLENWMTAMQIVIDLSLE